MDAPLDTGLSLFYRFLFLLILQVIHKLLSVFIKASVNNQSDNTTALDDLVLSSLPQAYIHKDGNLYDQLLDISCFVASLTDGNALEWYNKIS